MDIYINDHGIEKSKFENHYRSYKYLKGLIKTVNDKRRYPRCIHGNNKKKKNYNIHHYNNLYNN